MSRRCDLTQKAPQVGHKVSHSNIKTKRRFLPNLLNVTLMSDSLGKSFRLRISANALKSVDHRGGLDAFLMKARDIELVAERVRAPAPAMKARVLTARHPRRSGRNSAAGFVPSSRSARTTPPPS